jgi:hypothetical protein
VLQHGSIRVRADSAGARTAAGLDPDGATSLVELGGRGDIDALIAACARAFATALSADFEASTLSEPERSAAAGRSATGPRGADEIAASPRGFSRAPLDGR